MVLKTDHMLGAATPALAAGQESPAPEAALPTGTTHCPYRQTTLLQQALSPDKMRVAFFLGAGCPVAIRIPSGESTKPLIPDIAGLTEQVLVALGTSPAHKASTEAIMQRLSNGGANAPNIEMILSHVRALREVIGVSNFDGVTLADLDALDAEICRVITDIVKVRLDSENTPYHRLATWIAAIKRAHPVEVFTTNYDLLLEQALEETHVPYFDGFVGSDRAFFDIASMEQHESLPPRWARLWKVHGSINWWLTPDGKVQRREKSDGGARLLIHPSHLKYEESRRMPYLAMMDRLRMFLSEGQAILVTCGYSFSDQHLNAEIFQGLRGNPNAICFALLFRNRGDYPLAVAGALKHANLSLIAADGAIRGTIERDWHATKKADHPLDGLVVQDGEKESNAAASAARLKCLLGDFQVFGQFLARQLADRDVHEGGGDVR